MVGKGEFVLLRMSRDGRTNKSNNGVDPRLMPEFMLECALGSHHPGILRRLLLRKLRLAETSAIVLGDAAFLGQSGAVRRGVESFGFLEDEGFFGGCGCWGF